MKQIPFRYNEKTEKDFEVLFKLQHHTKKKNQAIVDSLTITSLLIKTHLL